MELKDLRSALRRHWIVAALAFVVCFGVGAAAALLPAKTYEARATVLAQPTPVAGGNPAQAASFQIPAILETVRSRTFGERVARDNPGTYRPGQRVSAESDLGTGIIRVGVRGRDPAAAAAWATALATTVVADNEQQVAASATVPTAGSTAPAAPLFRLSLLDQAQVPRTAVAPQPGPILAGSLLIAVIVAVLAAVAASRARRALDIGNELRRSLGAPLLGEVPSVRRLHGGVAVPTVLLDGPPQLVEAFQSLRTNVELAIQGLDVPVIAVTSWTTGEGKSTILAGLAASLARVDHEVLVVDADLRRPSQHTRLGEPFGEGVADATRVDPAALVQPTHLANLSFVPAGIPDRHPADVLAVALPKAVAALERSGRLMLIDAPPLHGVAESPLVLSVARHVIVVVDAANANLEEVAQDVARLRARGVTVLGVVVNRARRNTRMRTYERAAADITTRRAALAPAARPSAADGADRRQESGARR